MVECKICNMDCGIAITNKHLQKYHSIDLIEYKKLFGDKDLCWNIGLTRKTNKKLDRIFTAEFCAKRSENNRITWKDPITRAKRIAGIKEDYLTKDNSERNKKISIGSLRAFLDPIKRENKLRHIKLRKGNKEFGNKMRGYINKAIENGYKPENNAYTVSSYDLELGHIVRSKWERNFARLLRDLNIEYTYEPKMFKLNDCFFTPDFYLPKFDWYVEIVGVYRPKKTEKIKQMLELYPEVKLYILDGYLYQMLEKKFRELFERDVIQTSKGGDV